MGRELSTRFTWVYRWLIPGVLTVVAGGALWWFVMATDNQPDTWSLLPGIAIAAAALILARVFDRAKRVWIDGNQLIFSAYGKEHTMNVNDIAQVRETAYFRPHRIRLTFNTTTAFGTSILFFPPIQLRNWFAEHSCTSELKSTIRP